MTKSNMNTMTAFLLIAIIIGVGVYLGGKSVSNENNVIYYDWNTNNDLSLEEGVTIFTPNETNEYKSIKFDNNYNMTDNKDYVLSFKDKVNISNLDEYSIEFQITTNIGSENNQSFIYSILDNEVINNKYNGTLTEEDYYNNGSYSFVEDNDILGVHVFQGYANGGYVETPTASGFDFNRYWFGNVTKIKYKFNNVDKYLIITKTTNDNVETSFYTYEDISNDLDLQYLNNPNVFDLTELRFIIRNINPYQLTPTQIGINDSMTIDYLKLSYVETSD